MNEDARLNPYYEGTQANIASLSQRVTGLETGVRDIASSITGLASKLDESRRTPWGVICSAAGVSLTALIAIGMLAYKPVEEGQARAEAEIAGLQQSIVPRIENQYHWTEQRRLYDRVQKRLDRIDRDRDDRISMGR